MLPDKSGQAKSAKKLGFPYLVYTFFEQGSIDEDILQADLYHLAHRG